MSEQIFWMVHCVLLTTLNIQKFEIYTIIFLLRKDTLN